MAFRYEFDEAAGRDLYKLTRRDVDLLHAIATTHIPAILKDPFAVGKPKEGKLSLLRAYNLKVRNVAYRLIYEIDGDVIVFVAIGPHDTAYGRAERRT